MAARVQGIDEDGELSHSEDDCDQVGLPNLLHVKVFMLSGNAFQNLLVHFQSLCNQSPKFVLPQQLLLKAKARLRA